MIQFILLCNLKNYLLEVIKSAFSKYQFANAHPVDCWRASWCQFNWTIITLSFYYIYMPRSTVILCKLNCKFIQWLLGLSIVLASLISGPPSFIYPWIGPVCFSLIFFWNSKSHPSTVPPLMPPTSFLLVGERICYRLLCSLLTPPPFIFFLLPVISPLVIFLFSIFPRILIFGSTDFLEVAVFIHLSTSFVLWISVCFCVFRWNVPLFCSLYSVQYFLEFHCNFFQVEL